MPLLPNINSSKHLPAIRRGGSPSPDIRNVYESTLVGGTGSGRDHSGARLQALSNMRSISYDIDHDNTLL